MSPRAASIHQAVSCFLLCIVLGSRASGEDGSPSEALDDIQGVYERQQAAIEEEFRSKRGKLAHQYAAALGKVEEAARAAGRFEAVVAARKAREAAGTAKALPGVVDPGAPAELRELQEKAVRCLERFERERAASLTRLDDALERKLSDTVAELTKAGRMEGAVEARRRLLAFRAARPDRETGSEPVVPPPAAADGQDAEEEARRAFEKLLAQAGLAGGDDKAIIEGIRALRISRTKASQVERLAAAFARRHGETETAQERGELLAELADIGSVALPEMGRPPDISIAVSRGKRTRYSGRDYDDKRQNLHLCVKIQNKEMTRDFMKLEADLYLFGKSVTGDTYELLDRAGSEFDLPRRGRHEFQGRSVALDFDDNRYAKYGVKYHGYVVVVRDRTGTIIASKATQGRLLKELEKFKDAETGTTYTRNFEKTGSRRAVRAR